MTNLELKAALNVLRAEVTALRDRVGALEAKPEPIMVTVASEPKPDEPKTNRGLCPKCKNKPNHFFHVKNCTG